MGIDEKAVGSLKEEAKPRGTYIREVILENFMSHEYSRIPLKPGMNLITGPNGKKSNSNFFRYRPVKNGFLGFVELEKTGFLKTF